MRKIRSSGRSTDYLDSVCGKRLIFPARTRWLFNFYVIDRLLELEESVHYICRNILDRVNELTTMQWKELKTLRTILEPFELFVRKLEGQNYATLSRVIPAIHQLIKKTSEFQHQLVHFQRLSQQLHQSLLDIFAFIFSPNDGNFQEIYSEAMLFDPKVSRLMDLPDLRHFSDSVHKAFDCLLVPHSHICFNQDRWQCRLLPMQCHFCCYISSVWHSTA